MMNISLIIPTFNRAELLARLLATLTSQTYPVDSFEIFIVNDASTDTTEQICREYQQKIPNMIYLKLDKNSKQSTACNVALNYAKGKSVIFTDDDCLPESNWVEEMAKLLEVHPIVAGAIRTTTRNYTVLIENISQFHPFFECKPERKVDFIAGANMGFQRWVLDKIGFFEPGAPNPDTNLILRARNEGIPIFFSPKPVITHSPQKGGFQNIVRQTIRYSSSTIVLRNNYAAILSTPIFLRNSFVILVLSPLIALGKTFQIFFSNFKMLRYIHAIPGVLILKFAWCIGAYQGLRKNKQ